jgi:hypothetical protein
MSRQLELMNGVALLITAASLALMSLLALPVAAEPKDCRAGVAAGPGFADCGPVRR